MVVCVSGFNELAEKVADQLGSRPKVQKYNNWNLLHRRMLSLNPLFGDFVTGSKCGIAKFFFCLHDVAMKTHGSAELVSQFGSKGHWRQDVVYRVHVRFRVYNKPTEPVVVTANQEIEFLGAALC